MVHFAVCHVAATLMNSETTWVLGAMLYTYLAAQPRCAAYSNAVDAAIAAVKHIAACHCAPQGIAAHLFVAG